MKNAIKTQHAKLLENPTFNRIKDYSLHGVSSVQLFLIASAMIVFLVSVATQGFSGSTVVQSIGAIIGGGIAGAVTAFILIFLRLLLKQDSWKLASIILGVGITTAVFTGSYALQISMPPLAGFIGYVSGLILILNYFVRFQPKTELPLILVRRSGPRGKTLRVQRCLPLRLQERMLMVRVRLDCSLDKIAPLARLLSMMAICTP